MFSIRLIRVLGLSAMLSWLFGCAVVPQSLDNNLTNSDEFFIRETVSTNTHHRVFNNLDRTHLHVGQTQELNETTISRGDWLKLNVHSMPTLDGLYQIGTTGKIDLPFGESIKLAGLNRTQAIKRLRFKFKQLAWLNDIDTVVNVSVVRFASIDVSVFGAVFNPGRVTINSPPANKQQEAILQEAGAFTNNRNLISALAAAGGIRPDANLFNLMIKRGGQLFSIDISQLVDGAGFGVTPSLIQGDQIFVASNGVENVGLIRPTQITPPGMRVLMSNLTAPALNNALSAVGADATRLPYGSSLLDAALSANCVGGTHQANASRSIILITRHYGSSQQIAIRRSINQLLANASDHAINSFLMPNDGVACYDSKFTNIRDVARGIGEVFGPILIGGLL